MVIPCTNSGISSRSINGTTKIFFFGFITPTLLNPKPGVKNSIKKPSIKKKN